MTKLVVAKFGGSAIGADGLSIPVIIQRINSLKKDTKVITVFSAPLTVQNGKTRSLTDIVLEIGRNAENGNESNLGEIRNAYEKILELVSSEYREECKKIIEEFLEQSKKAVISNTLKNNISALEEEKKRKLMLIIPENAKVQLGI